MSTDISRRFFIGGAASFGAFAGCRFFECHDFRAGDLTNNGMDGELVSDWSFAR